MMNSSIVLRRISASPLVKRVRKLARQTHVKQRPDSDQVVSVDVRIRQADAGFTYADRLGQNRTQNHAQTIGQNLDCYI